MDVQVAGGVTAPIVSYGLVGLIGVAGRRGGPPGMALPRAVFGQRGDLLPGALIWVARWGWETINAVSGAYALLTEGVPRPTAWVVAHPGSALRTPPVVHPPARILDGL